VWQTGDLENGGTLASTEMMTWIDSEGNEGNRKRKMRKYIGSKELGSGSFCPLNPK